MNQRVRLGLDIAVAVELAVDDDEVVVPVLSCFALERSPMVLDLH